MPRDVRGGNRLGRLRYDPDAIAIIEDPDEVKRILRHLVKIGPSPSGFKPERLN